MSFSIKPDPNGTKTELVHGSKVGLTLTSLGAFLDGDAVQDMQPTTLRQLVGSSVPVGSVIAFAAATPPTGWFTCNGQYLSRVSYPRLFAVIGTTFGSSDSSNFRLPDLRGEFVRGWDEGRGADAGRGFGSWQIDMLKSHNHETLKGNSEGDNGSTFTNGWGPDNPPVPTSYTGGTETRPRNVAMLYCIRGDYAATGGESITPAVTTSRTWRSVVASRALEGIYSGDSGGEIKVSVSITSNAGSVVGTRPRFAVYVGGVRVLVQQIGDLNGSNYGDVTENVTFEVPANTAYSVKYLDGTNTLAVVEWSELRSWT
jgi:hypothetical protein